MCGFAGVKNKQKEGNMKKTINPAKLVCGILGLCTVVSIGGAISSSLAWYAYATRASLLFSGTSVYDNGQLQIGVKHNAEITALKQDGMIEEQINGSYYYFAPAGEGLSSERLNMYLSARGYATNELIPVTSGEFNPADNNHNSFALKQSPNAENYNNSEAATNMQFSQITFAFRAFRTKTNGKIEYVPNQEIWLTHAQTRASTGSSGNVSKAMRMYINRDATVYEDNKGFIYNPSSNNSGETKVGGLLNLGHDQYYDFDENGEIVYGEYTIKDGTDTGIINHQYDGPDQLVDINGSGSTTPDTFTAKHSPNAAGYYQDFNKLDIKTAKFEGVNTIKPVKATDGSLSNPTGKKTSVCKTGGDSVGNIGEFDATIYLEGWDFSVIDEEQSHKFDFQLRFETNRI